MDVAYPLAVAHHLALIVLVSALAAETVLLRPGLTAADVGRLARIDAIYGLAALALLGFGLARTVFGLKGWSFYAGNPFFWTKVALFVAVGLLSVPPTIRIARWKRGTAGQSAVLPADGDVAQARRWLAGEWTLLAIIPALAAALGQNL